jgi:3-hydroxyisobutyrate dehydrogenase
MKNIGFIGMGLMGSPMSIRLLKAGFNLTIWNRSPEKCLPLCEKGASQALSIKDLILGSDLIFLCLTDTEAVESVFNDIQPHLSSGQIIVDFSSIDPIATQSFSHSVEKLGAYWVDSPISGGVSGAESGSLAIMAGGNEATVDELRPLLNCLSSRVTYMGESGSGQYTKICNQMIVSCNALVIAEVIALAEKSGVNSQMLAKAFEGGFADSKPLQILAPEMSERHFEPIKWHVKTLLKDLDMAVEYSKKNQSSTPMSALAAQLMRLHASNGFSTKDPSTLINLYVQAANDEI